MMCMCVCRVAASQADGSEQTEDVSLQKQATFKYNMGWQKRGSGRAYNSKSGVGTFIGNATGKICAYGVRVSGCRTCTKWERLGKEPPSHKCYKNWTGSSKAMEPDVGAEVVSSVTYLCAHRTDVGTKGCFGEQLSGSGHQRQENFGLDCSVF